MDTHDMVRTILLTLILAANVACIVAYGVDKFNSKRRGQRISETRLMLLAFFGPFGALAAMLVFRHKTRKIKFLLVPFFAILQLLLLIWYFVPALSLLRFF